jgi:hypothetical protein
MARGAVSFGRIFVAVAYILPVAAPLLLLLDPQVVFPGDWRNHLWMVGHYGEHFRQHGDMPTALNFSAGVGIAQPVFYGYLLYPLLGLLSSAVGANVALRLGVALLLAVQFVALISAGNRIFGLRRIAYFIGVSMAVATYSLTNLFNRGAIPEFFGVGFFVTAVAWAATAAVAVEANRQIFFGWLAVVFLVLALGAHPPTTVLASATVAALGLGAAWGWWRERVTIKRTTWAMAAVAAAWGALVLAPWIFAAGKFGPQLSVASSSRSWLFLPDRSDSWWGRFSPIPYDRLGFELGIYDVGAPYLEAQVSMVLLAFLIWNLWLLRGRSKLRGGAVIGGVLVAAVAWFLGLAAVSVSPALAEVFRAVAPSIQYVYRLVSYCNVALLVAVFASGVMIVRTGGYRWQRRRTDLVLTACLTVTAVGALIKLQHGTVSGLQVDEPRFEPGGDRARLITVGPKEQASVYDYVIFGRWRELAEAEKENLVRVTFPVGTAGADFGVAGAVRIEAAKPGWVVTNALVFPWQEVTINGRLPAAGDVARVGQFIAVRVADSARELQVVWRPDRGWWILHRGSQFGLALGLFCTAVWAVWLGFIRGRARHVGV